MKKLYNFNKYSTYKELNEVEMVNLPSNLNFNNNYDISNMSEKEYEQLLGKQGKLSKHLRKNGKIFTFGLLKSIFHDAIEYKNRREILKGGYKMVHRAIPILLSYIYFPIWLIGNVLGFSRALNKILKPLLKNPEKTYNKFLIKFIKSTIHITEGEIKYIIGKDWFYNVFVMEDDILKMLNKKVIRNFAVELANKMEKEPDDNEDPYHYIENELKKYLNKEYKISPPFQFK